MVAVPKRRGVMVALLTERLRLCQRDRRFKCSSLLKYGGPSQKAGQSGQKIRREGDMIIASKSCISIRSSQKSWRRSRWRLE